MSNATCPACGVDVSGYNQETEVLERYMDGAIGAPNNPHRVAERPGRRMVPGLTTTTLQPCGHTV